MDLREQWLRHRKDNRLLFGALSSLLLICGAFYYLLQRGQGLPARMAANKVLLFVLWYINVILILAILFILVRSLFRLLLERRTGLLGSKFKTKLVLTAIALSLIPVLILFPFATRLLLDSFEEWFSLPVEQVLKQAKETADYLSEEIERNNQTAACHALDQLIGFDLADLRQQPALQVQVQQLRQDLEIDYLAVFDGLEPIHGSADIAKGFSRVPDFRGQTRLLEEAIAKGRAVARVEASLDLRGRLVLGACAAVRPESLIGESVEPAFTVVLAGRLLPQDIAQQSDSLVRAYQSYLQLSVQKDDLRTAYLLNLLMVTLLVVLAFSSIGLRLARRITMPIQALADGTRKISTGDLDHQIEVAVDDELGVLVDGFNHMTRELKRRGEQVEESQSQLVAATKRIQAVLQNVGAGVISIDADGMILTCNGAALSILQQAESEVVGHDIWSAWAEGDRGKLRDLLTEEFTAGGQLRRQLQLVIGGVWRTLEVKVTNLPDPTLSDPATLTALSRRGGRVVVLEDLTELINAQKLATWNEVARRIAHEIKNPLTPIRLTAERLLRRYQAQDPKLGETLELGVSVIVREVDSLKNLVDEFSRFARMPQPQPRAVDLDKLFAELVNLHRGLKTGVEIRAILEDDAKWVTFDPEQLKSVLINLIDNAIEALDAPGVVTLESRRSGKVQSIAVADTGPGIRAEDKEKIFQPYFSTKGRGSGLGLSIVHRIVHDHHAEIHVKDNHPQGTVFVLEVPVD
jgi:two-component system, NtrC family, nitrogen regulation sensor histidine kinase NtrY